MKTTRTVPFPVSYVIHGRLPGRKIPRSYIFAETRPARITHVARKDAPMAVSWKIPYLPTRLARSDDRYHVPMWIYDEDGRQHTVFHRGRHWVRLLNVPRFTLEGSTGVSYDHFTANVHSGEFNESLGFRTPTQGQSGYEFVGGDPANRFEEIVRHGRDASMALFDGLEFISVEGDVYAACDQPCFKLVMAWHGFERSLDNQPSKPVKTRFPVVDTKQSRGPLALDHECILALPMSAIENVRERCPYLDNLGGDFEWPIIHLPESISSDIDTELMADYLFHRYLATSANALGSGTISLDEYMAKTCVDGKLNYLLSVEQECLRLEAEQRLSANDIRKAIDTLEDISFSMVPLGSVNSSLRT